MRTAAFTLALVTLAGGPRLGADGPSHGSPVRRARFEAHVEVVNLSVTVVDQRRRHVGGLAPRDFQVFEDGVPQELAHFLHQDAPISLVLMVDSSGSMFESLPAAQAAAGRFLDVLREGDRARVVGFSDRDLVLQDFTSDRRALRSALARIQAGGRTALYKALYVALKDLRRELPAFGTRRLAVVLLSDGEDTASPVTDEQVLELARRSEIAVYAVGLKRPAELGWQSSTEATHFLARLARETGGEAHFPQALRDLDGVYARIAEELRMQYSMGYVSSNPRRNGRWRRIQVRTLQREDVSLRHRLGYYAPR